MQYFGLKNETIVLSHKHPLVSPRITGLTCISRVHNYVQKLPHDRFTELVPFYEYDERDFQSGREMLFAGLGGGCSTKANVVCTLHMPHLTPYREPIQGNQLGIFSI